MLEVIIRYCTSISEAREAVHQGACPIELCFGDESIIENGGLDHHGPHSDRQPVCIQAIQHLYCSVALGRDLCVCVDAPTYAVCGEPDADASLAIYLLTQEFDSADVLIRCAPVARIVGQADVGQWTNLSTQGDEGALVLAWHARRRADRDQSDMTTRWQRAIKDWEDLFRLITHGSGESTELAKAKNTEYDRIAAARTATWEFPHFANIHSGEPADFAISSTPPGFSLGDYGLVVSDVAGADVWYADMPTLAGYVAYVAETQSITISLRPGTAQGEGLLALAKSLGSGWGGRRDVVGSPRDQDSTLQDARDVLAALQEMMR